MNALLLTGEYVYWFLVTLSCACFTAFIVALFLSEPIDPNVKTMGNPD